MAPFVDKRIRVKFVGGREVVGILKGADPICNLVLDDSTETRRPDELPAQEVKREMGILVARGTSVLAICSEDGFHEIDNPYANEQE